MDTINKISLTIELDGSTLVRRSKPDIVKVKVLKKDLNLSQKWKGKEGFEVVKSKIIKVYPLIAKPAQQHINMSLDAYNYMISSVCPDWFRNPKAWRKMTQTQRLEAHLQRTCDHFNGNSFTYKILDD